MIVPPGSTIGILGGGQLGRMLAIAAAQLGYRTHIFAPEASGPATEVAAAWTTAAYGDRAALARFTDAVDVITYEFENVPSEVVETLANERKLHPCPRALVTAQDRLLEKDMVRAQGVRTAPYRPVATRDDLDRAIAEIGTPAILKTRRLGYDGKGQGRLRSPADADAAWAAVGGQPSILEGFVTFDREFSIILVRGGDGATAIYDAVENVHRDGILDGSIVPAAPEILGQAAAAAALARTIAESLGYVGVLACELFATAEGPVFNEMAPRVHNSGHWTIEGAETSQFENHVRAICGLPLGSTALTGRRIEMRNLIGRDAETWPSILAEPGAHLHLYGKTVRPGRKMGHVTRVVR